MNYKFLSSIFDFKNSERPEIFTIFKSDIFPALVLSPSPSFVHIDGNAPDHATTADYWWKYLDENLKNLRKGNNPKYILKTSDEYKRYDKLLGEFNKQMGDTITLIEEKTNGKLASSWPNILTAALLFVFIVIQSLFALARRMKSR